MKYLLSIILTIIVPNAYCQVSTSFDTTITIADGKISNDITSKFGSAKQSNNLPNSIKIKPRFRFDEEKTKGGIIVKNTFLGAVTGVIIGLTLVGISSGRDNSSDLHFREQMAIVGMGAAAGVPIGFLVGGVKALKHKRKPLYTAQ